MSHTRKFPRQPQEPVMPEEDAAEAEDEVIHIPDLEDAETIRSGSQTAQDRDHTIRGGDRKTAITKEFPT